MDVQIATNAVYQRLQALEADHASKVLGWLLSQPRAQQEVMRLAMASDLVLQSMLSKAKKELRLQASAPDAQSTAVLPGCDGPSGAAQVVGHHSEGGGSLSQSRLLAGGNLVSHRGQQCRPSQPVSRKSTSQQGVKAVSPPKIRARTPCFFFAKGICRHGEDCRFVHQEPKQEAEAIAQSPKPSSERSLQQLELELRELLAGLPPVHLSSIPKLYLEHFGRPLQLKASLDTSLEAQRQRTAGLTLLGALGRMTNTVAFVNRKQGPPLLALKQQALRVVANESEHTTANPDCTVVYLTFPPESTFSEEDVRRYFKLYGPVQDIKMSSATKRMFAYVTFRTPLAVKTVLAAGNPHTIAGCKVLVKPYKERGERPKDRYGTSQRAYQVQQQQPAQPAASPQPPAKEHDEAQAKRLQKEEQDFEAERRRVAILQIKEGSAQKRRLEAEAAGRVAATQGPASSREGNELANKSVFTEEQLTRFQHENLFGALLEEDAESAQGEEGDWGGSKHEAGHEASTSGDSSGASSEGSDSAPVCDDVAFSPLSILPTAMSDLDYTCSVCLEFFQEPIELDCHHTFCVPCISQVIKATKEECPICRQKVSAHMSRYLETRDPHWTAPAVTHHQKVVHHNQRAGTAAVW